jgi:hypothetical protein
LPLPSEKQAMMARKLIATPLAVTLIAAGPAAAQQVGTATAVNPMTESTQPGGVTGKLSVGARVMHKERVHTSRLVCNVVVLWGSEALRR